MGQYSHLLQVVARGEGRRASFPHPFHLKTYKKGVTCSPILMPSGKTHPCSSEQGWLYHATQARCKILSANVANNGMWDQLCTALSSRPLLVSGAMKIIRGHSCIRAMNPDVIPSRSPGQDITMVLGHIQAIHLSLLFDSFASLYIPAHRT